MSRITQSYRWNPPDGVPARSTSIYIMHGTGEHANRYTEFAQRLTRAGWVVGAHDHPGHGRSSGKRGLIDPAGSLATQAAIQIQSFAAETGTKPIVFGHSLGGLLITELVLEHGLDVAGLILSAPAYAVKMTTLDHLKLKLVSLFAPRLCLDLGYDPSRLTHDKDMAAVALADPLIHSFKSATLINWLLDSGKRSMDSASELSVPTLLLIAGDDLVADSEKIRMFSEEVSKQFITVREYKDAYHELLNELPKIREQVMLDIESWLNSFENSD